jgi:MFS transporter, OFA family, oxalate/formate antiporter
MGSCVPHPRRRATVAGAALLNACLGSLYAWSIFVEPLRAEFGWSATEVSSVFAVSLAVFCAVTVTAGRLADRASPRLLALIATACAGLGMLGSAATTSLWWLLICYAGVFGVGNGLGYVTAVTAAGRAVPDRRGTAVGIAVAGYALGPLLIAVPGLAIIDAVGWRRAFLLLAAALVTGMLLAAHLLGGRGPAGTSRSTGRGIPPAEMLRRREAYLLWLVFACGSFTGLMSVGHAAPVVLERGLSQTQASAAVSALAGCNAVGRLLAGPLSDRYGRGKALVGTMAACVSGAGLIGLTSGAGNALLAMGVVGLSYGGLAALVPAATADLFGEAHFGANFGLVFSAWGVGGLLGPVVGGWAAGLGGYSLAYLVGAALATVGLCTVGALVRGRV